MDLFHSTFFSSAQKHPNNIALFTTEHGQELKFTYQKLLKITTMWSKGLIALNSTQSPIAIYGAKQWQMYAGILAILQSKSAYVPLNTKQPSERNCAVLTQIDCQLMLVAEGEDPTDILSMQIKPMTLIYLGSDKPLWLQRLIRDSNHTGIRVDDIEPAFIQQAINEKKDSIYGDPDITVTFEDEAKKSNYAYILFTSGSTGTPKGIGVSHQNIMSHLNRLDSLLRLHSGDRVSQFFELSFDLSIHDMFSCWSKGATLCVIPTQQLMCPLPYIKKHQISVFSAVASLLSFMDKLSLLTPEQLPHLRLSCFGGEKLLTQQALKWQQCAHNSRVLNLYGPTECTITAMYYELKLTSWANSNATSSSVPIGNALPGLTALLMKDNKIVTKPHSLAELYLSGDQLVDGYWQDKLKTQQAFISVNINGIQDKQRLYKTGDICYYDDDNNMVFHGRNDHQFKVSGHRIEAADIESVIVAFDQAITWAVVQLIPLQNSSDQPRIAAFIEMSSTDCTTSSHNINAKDLRQYCLNKLPLYMVPDEFVFSEALPRNVSGKIDSKQLMNQFTANKSETEALTLNDNS